VYRGWTRYRTLGGKMLKNCFLAFLILVSLPAFACWKIDGTLGIDGETFKFEQKFEPGKEYSLPLGTFILGLKLTPTKNSKVLVSYSVQERKEKKLVLVTNGKEVIAEDKVRDIYAKGEPGQPHSIITIKIKNI
jgi:hypothetical protein